MFFNFKFSKYFFYDRVNDFDESIISSNYERKKYYSKFKRREVEYIDVDYKVISIEYLD